MFLKEDETIEDLQLQGLKIIQKKDKFRFGTDAVLLSDFVSGQDDKRILDLCTGSAIIPLLLSIKTKRTLLYGLELQPKVVDAACRSVLLNSLENRIYIKEGNVKEAALIYGKRSMDCITVNPPYKKTGTGILNISDEKTISRHEITCTLEDVIKQSSDVLEIGGTFYMVHRPSRLADIVIMMKKYKIEPKLIQFIYPSKDKKPVLMLIKGINHGGENLEVIKPIYLDSNR
jgi:tRNA1(Val) A37 N6-methylase TrmN6